MRRFGVGLLLGFCVSTAGCTSDPTGPEMPALDAATVATKALNDLDTDGNGKLAGAELNPSPGLKSALTRIDIDGDQGISSAELQARVDQYKKVGLAVFGITYTVRLDGQPLAGATVALIPEPSMADVLKPASGTTDATGRVTPMIDKDQLPGAYCGLYRIEVTKSGASLPARYNTATQLGQELAADVRDAEHGATLNLTSQ